MRVQSDERAAKMRPNHVMPLDEFPSDMRARIDQLAASDMKPPRWLRIGAHGSSRPIALMPSRAYYEWHWRRGIDPDKVRERLPQWLRAQVIERDGYVCGICGLDVAPGDVHIDHIYPVALGGRDDLENLRVAHALCNMRKGARV